MHISFNKRLHKVDVFSVNRFEIILHSDYTLEPLGGGEQKIHEFCILYLVKSRVSSKLKWSYKQKKCLGC